MRKIETPIQPQTFTDGFATFYCRKNIAGNGDRPEYKNIKRLGVPFEEKQVSDVRYYTAVQADATIDKVIRVPCVSGLNPKGDICVLAGSSAQYEVAKISRNGKTNPESWDVTLEEKKSTYELEDEE